MHKQEINAKVSALKRDIIVPCTRLFEGAVPRINYSKGYSNKSITSNHSTEYAYSTIMYKLFELIILDVIAGNIVYLDSKRKAKLYVDSKPATTEIIMGKNAEKAGISLIDFRASRYTIPVMIFDTGYKSSTLMQCFLPKYLYSALVDNINSGKKYPKGTKVFWANKKAQYGDRYKHVSKRVEPVLSRGI